MSACLEKDRETRTQAGTGKKTKKNKTKLKRLILRDCPKALNPFHCGHVERCAR